MAKRLTDNHQIVICDYVIEELRLVTGDKDFLVLDVEMPEIITMAEFLKQYQKEAPLEKSDKIIFSNDAICFLE